jgi:hypothetical protein
VTDAMVRITTIKQCYTNDLAIRTADAFLAPLRPSVRSAIIHTITTTRLPSLLPSARASPLSVSLGLRPPFLVDRDFRVISQLLKPSTTQDEAQARGSNKTDIHHVAQLRIMMPITSDDQRFYLLEVWLLLDTQQHQFCE